MESLYTKYRPQTFEQVVGQGHVVATLKRAVLEGRTSHAYLFCGPRGTGKTTMARILAKALMCDRGPAALPDGSCEQCRLIAAGEHPDVMELDAASRTGVDNVREEIISRVSFAPTLGRCKVYIIDEVHMLTTAAFNALLKTLEEPPSHVVFVMCTTDPQKILPTILSRVQRFDFHAIGNEEMQAHLAYVCSQEGFAYDSAALELIVRHARGGMRDALTSLEQLAVFGGGRVDLAAATDFLGEVSGSVLGSVSRAIARRDVPALFAEVAALADAGRDLLQFARELAAHVRDAYVVSVAPSSDDVVAARGEELEALRSEAAAYGSPDRLARVLTLLGDASNEMRTATNQRLVLEIAFTRMARPESDLTLESLAERVADLERQVAILSTPGAAVGRPVGQPATTTVPAAVSERRPAATEPMAASERPAATATAPAAAPAPTVPATATTADPAQATSVPAASAPAAPAPAPGGFSNGELQRTWKRVVDALVASAPAKGSLLLSSTAVSDDGQTLTVSLPKGSRFAARMLERADVRESVDTAVEEGFGPRRVVYVEASLAASAISKADRASRAPRAASPEAPVSRTAPAPRAEPAAPVPADPVVPQPSSQAAATPAPAVAGYPMPWDAPANASAPAPVPAPAPAPAPVPSGQGGAPVAPEGDVVPYEDFDVAVYEEEYEPAPVAPPQGAFAAGSPEHGLPTREPVDAPAPAPTATAASTPAPASVPADLAELPDEFASIVSMLSSALGAPLSVSIESASSDADYESEELAYDDGGLDDADDYVDDGLEDDGEDD